MEQFDEKIIAKLLLSVKPHGIKGKRPFGPIQVASLLNKICESTPKREVAQRLGLSTEMIREFLSLLKLPKSIKQQFFTTWDIGIDRGYRISMLRNKKDQRFLTKAIAQHDLTPLETRSVVRLKRLNPSMPIKSYVQKILDFRPKSRRCLVLTGVDTTTLQTLRTESEKSGASCGELVEKIVKKNLPNPNSLTEFNMRGKLIRITLEPDGLQALKKKAKELRVVFDNLVDNLVKDWLKNPPS